MKMRFHIIMENVAGKLDERFADNAAHARKELIDMIEETYLRDGDCFRVVDRQHDDD